jgi:hypothetical protein
MTFELYRKTVGSRESLQGTTVSLSKTTISFGMDIQNEISDSGTYAEIYTDKENLLVGFRFVERSLTGFKLHKESAGKQIVRCSPGRFLKTVPKGRHEAEKQGDMWVIKVDKFLN